MKKTLNVNIGSMAFTIDEDAYVALRDYLEDISLRLAPEEQAELMEDVESRVADIISNNLSMKGQVVSLANVRQAMAVIGRADCFGERSGSAQTPPPPPYSNGGPRGGDDRRRLYRSRNYKAIAGLCGGIAEYMGWDPSMVRVATVLLVFLGGLSLWVYIILWIVIPLEPYDNYYENFNNKQQRR